MKTILGLSSLFSFIVFLVLQTSVSSCTKDVTKYDTVTVTQVDTVTQRDTLVITDTTVTMALLTAHSWKMQEIRGVIGNTVLFYQRGGTTNTENYDNEYINFNADGSGTLYDAAGTNHAINWSFSNDVANSLTFIVYNPPPIASQNVVYENLRFKNNTLLFDQYWTYNGINSHAQAVRAPF